MLWLALNILRFYSFCSFLGAGFWIVQQGLNAPWYEFLIILILGWISFELFNLKLTLKFPPLKDYKLELIVFTATLLAVFIKGYRTSFWADEWLTLSSLNDKFPLLSSMNHHQPPVFNCFFKFFEFLFPLNHISIRLWTALTFTTAASFCYAICRKFTDHKLTCLLVSALFCLHPNLLKHGLEFRQNQFAIFIEVLNLYLLAKYFSSNDLDKKHSLLKLIQISILLSLTTLGFQPLFSTIGIFIGAALLTTFDRDRGISILKCALTAVCLFLPIFWVVYTKSPQERFHGINSKTLNVFSDIIFNFATYRPWIDTVRISCILILTSILIFIFSQRNKARWIFQYLLLVFCISTSSIFLGSPAFYAFAVPPWGYAPRYQTLGTIEMQILAAILLTLSCGVKLIGKVKWLIPFNLFLAFICLTELKKKNEFYGPYYKYMYAQIDLIKKPGDALISSHNRNCKVWPYDYQVLNNFYLKDSLPLRTFDQQKNSEFLVALLRDSKNIKRLLVAHENELLKEDGPEINFLKQMPSAKEIYRDDSSQVLEFNLEQQTLEEIILEFARLLREQKKNISGADSLYGISLIAAVALAKGDEDTLNNLKPIISSFGNCAESSWALSMVTNPLYTARHSP